jgi:hypothetical protein
MDLSGCAVKLNHSVFIWSGRSMDLSGCAVKLDHSVGTPEAIPNMRLVMQTFLGLTVD